MFTKNKMVFDGDMPADGICCIYLLVCDVDGVVYVGQTTSLKSRIRQHANSEKKFDRFEYQTCHMDSANEMECENIIKYNPVLNTVLPTSKKHISLGNLKRLLVTELTSKIDSIIFSLPRTFDRGAESRTNYKYVSVDLVQPLINEINKLTKAEK